MSTAVQGFRLSPQQKHAWRLQSASRAHRLQAIVEVAAPTADSPERLASALAAVVGRHQALHTLYRKSPGIKFPIQVPSPGVAPALQTVEASAEDRDGALAEARALLAKAARRPFDLERGPLVHAWLVRSAGPRGAALLALDLPLLAADLASLTPLLSELATALADPDRLGDPDEIVQYLQFSDWQNELLEGEEGQAGRDHWQRAGRNAVRDVEIPETAPRPTAAYAPATVPLALPADRLGARARALGIGERDLLLTAWLVLLARLSGRSRVGLGLGTDGRSHEDLRGGIGLFARTLPLALDLDLAGGFAGAAARVAEAAAEAVDYQDFFAASTGDSEAEAAPDPAAFEFSELPASFGDGALILVEAAAPIEPARACLVVLRRGEELTAGLRFDERALAADAAGRLAQRLSLLLDELLDRPDAPLDRLPLLTPDEEQTLLRDANQTAARVPERTLHALLAEAAAAHADDIALVAGASTANAIDAIGETAAERRLTFRELDAAADALAHRLRGEGIAPGRRVGLFFERSPEMIVALLAVLKAGGAYVPLDPTYPLDRLAFLVDDAELSLVLTHSSLAGRFPEIPGGRTLAVDGVDRAGAGTQGAAAAGPPEEWAGPDDLAYVLYTSGSTGRPKGVMVPHRGLVNYLTWAVEAYGAAHGGGAPVHSPLGFDLTVTSLFAPLLAGRPVRLLSEARGVEELAAVLREPGGFALVKLTPAHLALLGRELAEVDLAGRAGTLVLGGEQLLGESLRDWRARAPATRLVNEYGPTETTVGCIVYEVSSAAANELAAGPVPIGRPIANTEVYLLDAGGVAVPTGVPGEIYLGGAGLARGYLARPDRTAEAFVPHPFSNAPGARLYRTGDLARRRADGNLEFLGRNDHQVKIRGYRIELGEVEAVLATHPAIRECAVLAREDTPGERRLVAYLVLAPTAAAPSVDELRRFLASRLPEPMMPSAFLTLNALPLTGNGKVDRALLPAPGSARPQLEREYLAPRTPVEEAIATTWSEVLGIEKVGVHDSFFALGGDSIRSVQVIAALKEKGIDATVEMMFRHQTIEDLAAHLTEAAGAAADSTGGADLASLVESLEGMSEEEARALLREHLSAGSAGSAGPAEMVEDEGAEPAR